VTRFQKALVVAGLVAFMAFLASGWGIVGYIAYTLALQPSPPTLAPDGPSTVTRWQDVPDPRPKR
jgi:hypothetical protein